MSKMSSQEYFNLVDHEIYPDEPSVPRGDEPFSNEAGTIFNLFSSVKPKFGHISMIYSRPGSVRSNHYHLTDWHYMFVSDGLLWYYWRKVGETRTPEMRIFRAGQIVFTPPMVEHACFFVKDTTMFVASRNVRDHANHESDLIRVKLIEDAVYDDTLKQWQIQVAGR